MGKSFVTTNSTAIDNRLAVTDNAVGLSSSGTANQVALGGSVLNANSGASISILDGGAVNRAFSFAENSLSDMLSAVILGQKNQQEAAQHAADTVGAALQQSAATSAAASAASDAAASELASKKARWVKEIGVGVAVAGIGWWLWGRKK